jgi:hypothetical protein
MQRARTQPEGSQPGPTKKANGFSGGNQEATCLWVSVSVGVCCLSSVSVVWRRRDLAFFFFFLRFSFFPVSPGSVLYLDLCFFLSGSLFFYLGWRFCVAKYKIDGRSLQNRQPVVVVVIGLRTPIFWYPYMVQFSAKLNTPNIVAIDNEPMDSGKGM